MAQSRDFYVINFAVVVVAIAVNGTHARKAKRGDDDERVRVRLRVSGDGRRRSRELEKHGAKSLPRARAWSATAKFTLACLLARSLALQRLSMAANNNDENNSFLRRLLTKTANLKAGTTTRIAAASK